MNPMRQRLLRIMHVMGEPVTTKRLADEMDITPASAKHHLAQLESIGLVVFDHSEVIHGITARYYRPADVDISLGMDEEYRTEKEIIAENLLISVFRDLMDSLKGDCHTGVVHLTETEYDQLQQTILRFIADKRMPGPETKPYEFGLVYCEGKKKK